MVGGEPGPQPGTDLPFFTGDFNGDLFDTLAVQKDSTVTIYQTGASETVGLLGYWESGVTWTLINGYSPEWKCVATGDFNADGKCDMLWRRGLQRRRHG